MKDGSQQIDCVIYCSTTYAVVNPPSIFWIDTAQEAHRVPTKSRVPSSLLSVLTLLSITRINLLTLPFIVECTATRYTQLRYVVFDSKALITNGRK
jgi:hypothetical protein